MARVTQARWAVMPWQRCLAAAAAVFSTRSRACNAVDSNTHVTISAGSSSQDFYYQDSALGTPAITATIDGFLPISQTLTITAGPPTQLIFTGASVSNGISIITPGICSTPYTLTLKDALGNAAKVTQAGGLPSHSQLPVTAHRSLFTPPVIARVPRATPPLSPKAAPSGVFSVLYGKNETVTLTATAGSLTRTLQIRLTNVIPVRLKLTASSATFSPAFCDPATTTFSSGTYSMLTLTAVDAAGNEGSVGPTGLYGYLKNIGNKRQLLQQYRLYCR